MKTKLNPGDIVTVYTKPLTDEHSEGIALLESRADRFADSLGHERWNVRFVSPSGRYEVQTNSRLIHARNIIRKSNP